MRRAVAVLLVLAAGACRRHEDVYPAEVVSNFLKTCETQAEKHVCRCALDAVEEKFTLEQFQAFEARVSKGDFPKEFMDAVAECRE